LAIPFIIGSIDELTNNEAWEGTSLNINTAVNQIYEVLARMILCDECQACPDCPECEDCSNEERDGCRDSGGCEMGCGCTLPDGSIRVNKATGKLQYFTCKGWVDVEDWDGVVVVDPPPSDSDVDPAEGYACNKAYGLAGVIGPDLVVVVGQLQTYSDNSQRLRGIRYVLGDYDITWSEAQNIISKYNAATVDVDTAIADTNLVQRLACLWSRALDNTADFTSEEYSQMKAALAFYYSAGVREFISAVIDGIGFSPLAWFARITYDETADCTCPDETASESERTASGWYTVGPFVDSNVPVPIGLPTSETWGYAYHLYNTPHDVFGAVFKVEFVSGSTVGQIKRSNDPIPASGWDVYINNSNSDTLSMGTLYAQMGTNALTELVAAGILTPYHTALQDAGGDYSDNVAVPIATGGQGVLETIAVQKGSSTSIVKISVWWLCNENSASHT